MVTCGRKADTGAHPLVGQAQALTAPIRHLRLILVLEAQPLIPLGLLLQVPLVGRAGREVD